MRRLACLVCVTVSVGLAGCMWHKPPEPGKPSATVGFRVNHTFSYPLGRLVNSVHIDGKYVSHRSTGERAYQLATRVMPGWREYSGTSFFRRYRVHHRLVTETRSYQCGSSVCTRSETRRVAYRTYYTVGYCYRRIAAHMLNGGTYTIDYQYQGAGQCTLECYQQTKQPDGTFAPTRCPHVKVLQ
ncbi:MAG: hypothetical protein ABI333_22835 [bacterium]